MPLPLNHPPSRRRLQRRAFERAVTNLQHDLDFGLIDPIDAKLKYDRLYAAWKANDEQTGLASFLGSRGFANLIPNIKGAAL